MDQKRNSRWGVTLVAAALLIMAAANLYAISQINGLRQELNAVNAELSSTVEALQNGLSSVYEEFQNSLDRTKEELRDSIEREESVLAECKVEVGQYNSVANTVHVTFQSTPKVYKDGVNLLFMYTCDKNASVTLTGTRDDNGVFKAEADIPLCEVMNVKVVVNSGGVLYTETVEEALEVRKKVFLPLANEA